MSRCLTYLVSVVGGSSGSLALLARGELGQVTVVITLPVTQSAPGSPLPSPYCHRLNVHLVVKDLGLSRFGLGDQGVVKNIEHVLADLFELGLDLLAVLADDANVLVGTLLLLLLLNGGDDAPGGTAGTNDVLVSDGEKVTLVDGKLASDLEVEFSKVACIGIC